MLCLGIRSSSGQAQDGGHAHHHDHGRHAEGSPPVERPKVFLDKSPRIVWYQLDRLDNERLLLVDRSTGDPKSAPVYTAILTRAGMSLQFREEALDALVELNASDAVAELLKGLERLDAADRQSQRNARQLADMLLRLPAESLNEKAAALLAATESDHGLLRSIGHAGLITAGESDAAWERAQTSESATLDWLAAVSYVPRPAARAGLRGLLLGLIGEAHPANIRRAALAALAHVPSEQGDTLRRLAPFVSQREFRPAAIRTLLTIPAEQRDPETSRKLVDVLVQHAENTPAAQRTTDEFIDAMQLADQLLARVPVDVARSVRQRLRETTVRVVRIHTVEEEMRYDTPYFAVEAGRSVQVVLKNEDLMPHNLVVTVPGALQEIAELGLAAGPDGGFEGKQYVPHSDKMLHATQMVEPGKQEALTFTAPAEPGEYPYVCTFPRHWMRMYGVMVVVDDLDAWLKNPVEPKDPVGSNRPFVQAWTVEDLQDELASGLRGRSPEIGLRIFTEASCAQCHKAAGQGGAAGPDLTDVFQRRKGDRLFVLREILDPSHRIEPDYAVQLILTGDGKTVSGIVKAEDKDSVSVLVNPEANEPTVIPRSNIEEMIKTSTSMMPKALLDRFSKDEIFELLAFLEGLRASSD